MLKAGTLPALKRIIIKGKQNMRTILEDYRMRIEFVSFDEVEENYDLKNKVINYALKHWDTCDYNAEASHCDNCDQPSNDLHQYRKEVWFCKPCLKEFDN